MYPDRMSSAAADKAPLFFTSTTRRSANIGKRLGRLRNSLSLGFSAVKHGEIEFTEVAGNDLGQKAFHPPFNQVWFLAVNIIKGTDVPFTNRLFELFWFHAPILKASLLCVLSATVRAS